MVHKSFPSSIDGSTLPEWVETFGLMMNSGRQIQRNPLPRGGEWYRAVTYRKVIQLLQTQLRPSRKVELLLERCVFIIETRAVAEEAQIADLNT